MEVGVCSVRRIILGRLRSLARIGVQICRCSGSCGPLVCRRAASVGNVVVVLNVLNMVGEDWRRATRFVGVGVSTIHVPWGVGMSVVVRNNVRRGVSLVDIGLAGWSHSLAE